MKLRRFLSKIILFLIGLIIILFLLNYSINKFLNTTKSTSGVLYIWGDSQAYQGLNLTILRQGLNKIVKTSAEHGAGIYNFIVFANQVPPNSNVIIAYPRLSFIRRKSVDNNKSILSISALKLLYQHNYSLKEVKNITLMNLRPRPFYSEKTMLYPQKDTLNVSPPVKRYVKRFQKVPNYFYKKQALFNEGIKILIKKNCKITFIDFPFHQRLQHAEKMTEFSRANEKFTMKTISKYSIDLDTLYLPIKDHLMYDLTHLNETGANILANDLIKMMKNDKIGRKWIVIRFSESK